MAVVPYPDLAGAIRAHLRACPELTALVADRVWIGWPRDADGALRVKVPPFLNAILIEAGRGGEPYDDETPYQIERVDLSCLGATEADAQLVWRTVAAYLVDPRRLRDCTFRAANTLVSMAYQEGGPIRQLEPGTNWPRTIGTYRFRYCAIPVSDL